VVVTGSWISVALLPRPERPANVNGNSVPRNGGLDANGGGGTFPCAINGYNQQRAFFYTFDLSLDTTPWIGRPMLSQEHRRPTGDAEHHGSPFAVDTASAAGPATTQHDLIQFRDVTMFVDTSACQTW